MVEVLQYYTSSFGVWLGITLGMTIIGQTIITTVKGRR